jgi:membrane protein implicated in regulation of membrane protease activity
VVGIYPHLVKEFAVYTLLRLVLLAGSFAIVAGIWLAVADEVPLMWVLVIAFVMSGVASYFILNRPRERLAQRVDERARRASAAFEARKAREDVE